MSCIKNIFGFKPKSKQNIKIKTVKKLGPMPKCQECVICFNQIVLTEIITLDCTHTFHCDCLADWFTYNLSCPMCRKNVISQFSTNSISIQTINFMNCEKQCN